MTWPTPPSNSPISTEHLDGGTKKPAQARPDLKALTDRVNQLEGLLKTIIDNGSPMLPSGSVNATGVLPAVFGAKLGNQARPGADVLDWYEEGDFSPGLYFVGTINVTSAGKFVRVGKLVFFSFLLNYSGLSGTAGQSIRITGLPYANTAEASHIERFLDCTIITRVPGYTGKDVTLRFSMVSRAGAQDAAIFHVDRETGPIGGAVNLPTDMASGSVLASGAYFLSNA